jgi:hypothetical protein
MNRNFKKFNFPAFPVTPYIGDRDNPPVKSNTGMSMKDFFASSALCGIVTTDDGADPINAAKMAYQYADAMMDLINQ